MYVLSSEIKSPTSNPQESLAPSLASCSDIFLGLEELFQNGTLNMIFYWYN